MVRTESSFFHFLSAGVFDSRQRYRRVTRTRQRRVETYELEYFLQDGGVSHINQDAYDVKAGHVLLARPGDIRYSELHIRCLFVHFNVTNESLLPLLGHIPSFQFPAEPDAFHRALSAVVADCFCENGQDRALACARLLLLLNDLAEAGAQSHPADAAEQYIKTHCTEELTAEGVAETCHISVSYLHRLFKERYGVGPMEYANERRMAYAKQLLLKTGRSVTEIADLCGFHSQSYFSCAFKRHTGLSPAAFRRKRGYISTERSRPASR